MFADGGQRRAERLGAVRVREDAGIPLGDLPRAGHERAVHLLSLLDQRTGFTLSQMEVDGKTNEHKAALEILKTLVLKGRVITGDAIFCQRDLCQAIIDDDGHYFFQVKDNQPELKKAIAAEFEPAFSPLQRAPAA